MSGLLFGTGGIPNSTPQRSTVAGIERIKELGLGCMEVEFVQGVTMSIATAESVKSTAEENGIVLSCHAPYFINLNSHEVDKVKSSRKRLLQTAHIAQACGARNIIFHAAFYMDDPPDVAYEAVKKQLSETLAEIHSETSNVILRPEVTGKPTQFGTVEEILRLCQELPGMLPCIDLAHWHARTGANSYEEAIDVFKQVEKALGKKAIHDMHFHFSGIKYGERGEISHLQLEKSDLNYRELLRAMADYGIEGLVICESPREIMEDDALLLQNTYRKMIKTKAVSH